MQTFGKIVIFVVALGVIGYFVQQRMERNREVQARNEQVARENAKIEQEEAAEAEAASPRGQLDVVASRCKARITEFVQHGQQVTVTLESNTRDAFQCFLTEAGLQGVLAKFDATYNVPFQEMRDTQGNPLFRHSYRFTVR